MNWQQTIASSTMVQGIGYWSGQDVQVEFHPAGPDTGIVFVRRDIDDSCRIPAAVIHRLDTPRRTDLGINDVRVEMIEHIMATLHGLGIDNCEIRVNRSEMPGCDGSSRLFADAISKAGVVRQTAARHYREITVPIRIGDDQAWIEAVPSRNGRFTLSYDLDYGPTAPIPQQQLTLDITPESFLNELAPARTFLLKAEAEWLVQQGLGTHATEQDLLVFGDNGPIGNRLRYEDECVRHKLLDMLGDFALSGCRLIGHIRAYKTGHHHNAQLVQSILETTQDIGTAELSRCA